MPIVQAALMLTVPFHLWSFVDGVSVGVDATSPYTANYTSTAGTAA